jgi:class 3 adenylate cyclase/tetratricopeptide (TPR) repeat protein
MRTAVSVSVLFTDLVESTALSSRLGAQAAEKLRRTHFGLLRAAAAEHGGREVKNLGDGLMVAFPGVGAALDAAVAMQQAIDRHNRAGGEPLAIRVGVATGDAEEDDGDLFGEPVVAAARLCAAADGGAILVPEVLRVLAPRGSHEFRPVGDLDLKGLPEPVPTAEVAWSSTEDAPGGVELPLPARLAVRSLAGFVGRVAERELLDAARKSAAGGERRGVFLGGEAGMGKTRLASEVAAEAHEAGAVVLYGRCDEELAIPYQPWVEALGHYVTHADADALHRNDPSGLAELTRLVPQLCRRMPDLPAPVSTDPSTERHLLFGAVVGLLGEIARDQLCVVVLDDLHWADRPSVQLLRQVVATIDLGAVLVVGTYRDTDLDAEHPMTDALAGLHRERGVDVVALHGLGDTEVVALLESVAGHEMLDDGIAVAHAVRAETDGNPFFVGEVLRHLAETGAIVQQDGRWVAATDLAEIGLPASVRAVVGQRVRRLGDVARQVLTAAAVIGRDFDVNTVAAVVGLEEDDVLDALDAANIAGLVAETTALGDRFTFTHALVQHTLYDELTGAKRVRLHHRVAEALEASLGDDPGDRIGELANHWLAATRPADLDKAITYAQRAGDRAMAALAPDDAVRWYTQALDALDQQPSADLQRRCALLVGLGTAQGLNGIAAHRETLLDAARLADEIDEVDLLVRAALANSRGFFSVLGLVDHDRVAVIDRVLARLDDPDSAERARLLSISSAERVYAAGIDERLALSRAAVATARRSGDDRALLEVLARQNPITVPWTLELRTEWISEACRLADRSDDPSARMSAHTMAMTNALERADREDFWRHAAATEPDAQLLPRSAAAWTVAFGRVLRALLRGELDEAEELAGAALALGSEEGQPDALGIWGAQWANVRTHQGRFGEAIPVIEQGKADAPGLEVWDAVLADAYARSGNGDSARRVLDSQVAAGLPMPPDVSWAEAHACWADAAACVHHTATAAVVRGRIEPFADQIVTTQITIRPPFAHSLGLCDYVLGHYDAADKWFERAVHIEEQLEAPMLVAETKAAWALLLADRHQVDDHARARELATAALEVATAGGYGDAEADARAALERIG